MGGKRSRPTRGRARCGASQQQGFQITTQNNERDETDFNYTDEIDPTPTRTLTAHGSGGSALTAEQRREVERSNEERESGKEPHETSSDNRARHWTMQQDVLVETVGLCTLHDEGYPTPSSTAMRTPSQEDNQMRWMKHTTREYAKCQHTNLHEAHLQMWMTQP